MSTRYDPAIGIGPCVKSMNTSPASVIHSIGVARSVLGGAAEPTSTVNHAALMIVCAGAFCNATIACTTALRENVVVGLIGAPVVKSTPMAVATFLITLGGFVADAVGVGDGTSRVAVRVTVCVAVGFGDDASRVAVRVLIGVPVFVGVFDARGVAVLTRATIAPGCVGGIGVLVAINARAVGNAVFVSTAVGSSTISVGATLSRANVWHVSARTTNPTSGR